MSSFGLFLSLIRIKARQQAREQSNLPISTRRSIPRQFTTTGFELPKKNLTIDNKCNYTNINRFPARINTARLKTTQNSIDFLKN